jgi:hypothetical protein
MSRETMHFYGARPWCGKKRMLSLLRIESKTKDASAHGLLLCVVEVVLLKIIARKIHIGSKFFLIGKKNIICQNAF